MKRALQVAIILLLLAIVILQVLSLTGRLSPGEKQEVCPVNAISILHGKAVIDSTKCIGCRRCVDGFVAIPTEEFYLPGGLPPIETDTVEETDNQPAPTEPDAVSTPVKAPKMDLGNKQQIQADKETQKEPILAAVEELEAQESPEEASYYVVEAESCISCGMCLRVCPEDAISYVDGKAFIDPEKCSNCGICAGLEPKKFRGCPVGAIHPAQE